MCSSPRSAVPGRVLIVDHDPDAAESMAILLRLRGHDAFTAADLAGAIEVARRDQPGCILLHVTPSRLRDRDVVERVRSELDRPVVLVAVADCDLDGTAREALATGFDHHFIRPVDRAGLENLLSTLVDAAQRHGRSSDPTSSPDCDCRVSAPPSPTVCRRVEVSDPLGLHLRPASRFVAVARRFASEVRVHCDGRWVNGKSILDLATLAATCGDRLDLEAVGPDADEALEALVELFSTTADRVE